MEEPRGPMNLIGTMMNQRSARLSRNPVELSDMEVACLKLVANGFRAPQISEKLDMAEEEIEIVLTSAQQKLGAKNRLHAVGVAVSQGLVGIEIR